MINFDSIKSFMYMILGFIVLGAITAYKYMAMKIERQAEEIDSLEAEGKAKDFQADNREAAAKAEATDYEEVKDGKILL